MKVTKSLGKVPNYERNEALVVLSKEVPKYYTVNRLARVFLMTKSGAAKIRKRDWEKYSMKEVKKKSTVIHRKRFDKGKQLV